MTPTAGQHFNSVAGIYDETMPAFVRDHYLARRAGFIASLLPAGKGKVLDFGCGTGRLVHALRAFGIEADGLDNSEGMLAEARKGAGSFIIGEVDAVPVAGKTYDLAYTVAVLHHLVNPRKVAGCLKEMCRVVRKGGKVLVVDHNPLNPYWPLFMKRLPQDGEETRLVGAREIREGLRAAGTAGSSVRRVGWVPDFTPAGAMPAVRGLERLLERIPLVRAFGASNVVVTEVL